MTDSPHLQALCRFRTVWPIDLHLRPFALGHVMAKSGNSPPAMQTASIPNRALMMATDVHRSGHYWGVPLHPLEVSELGTI
jgi:glutathione S-transferase kappa 1